MQTQKRMLAQLDAIIRDIRIVAVKRELQAVAHKIRFPMTNILSRVAGDTLSDRARAIGVSRQTMYVWADERFRPIGDQANAIAKLANVPVAQILSDGYENEPPRRKPSVRASRSMIRRAPAKLARKSANR